MRQPAIGQLIRYAYLWLAEHEQGLEEGLKDRPCLVVMEDATLAPDVVFFVAPVTHTQPRPEALAVELPAATKQRLRLDDARSWIITEEVNKFTWPGPDIRPDGSGEVVIGYVPGKILERVIANLRSHALGAEFHAVARADPEG
ncbi:MAG: type II toxin-antitoxin system PemK/MazF family toxin [Alphaproteobacteria bacterium]|nr:type II toxin-antitoxin system PemK/MazF family toxin [Alphaproteobacteria bacterium]MBV9370413.1 type II toxin-antitoxin system PemK/MazF family toxin [Alphaproteobacteria bacterium]MBV9900847.1 type II toxin-antitoxin system PemK/MazF family toxin [Alphaproteobacteria bacterium]